MKRLVRYLWRGRGPLWVTLLALIALVSGFSFLLPGAFQATLDTLLPRGDAWQFHLFCAVVTAVMLLRAILNLLQDYLFLRVRQHVERGLLGELFGAALRLPLARWEQLTEAELVSRIGLVLTHFQSLLSEIVYYCAYALLVAVAVTVVLAWINPVFLAVSVAFLLLHAANFFLHYPLSLRFSQEYAVVRGELATGYRELLRGRKYITLAGLERASIEAVERDNRRLYQAAYRRDRVEAGLGLAQQVLHGLNYLALVVAGTLAIFTGAMSPGSMGLSLLLVGFAYEPLYRLSRLTKALSEVDAHFARVLPLLEEGAAAAPAPAVAPAPPRTEVARLELRGVDVDRGGTPVLRGVSAALEAGHLYLITGPSGAGKTTLLHVLAGLLPPSRGELRWDGTPTADLAPDQLAALRTLCPQQSLLLDGSALDNVTLFAGAPDPDRVARALELAAADFVPAARAGDVVVENEGGNLSGGQRQRLHLARAWYRPAPVMLFDEPTASLDRETEELVLSRLASQIPGRIIVIVSHSAAATRYATRTLALSHGTLTVGPEPSRSHP